MPRWNNYVKLQGLVGTVPTMTNGASGAQSARFRLGVKRKKAGQDVTDWFTVWTNGQQATRVQQTVGKGARILVEGSIILNERQDQKSGQMKLWADVWADNIILVGTNIGQGTEESAPEVASAAPAPAPVSTPTPAPAPAPIADEVPDEPPF